MKTVKTKAERIAERTPINQRALLNRAMAADYLSVSETFFRSLESSKDVQGIPIGTGKERRYRRADLDELIEKMAAGQLNIDKVKLRVMD